MRDCLFLVADKNMEGMLKGFFSRDAFYRAVGCRHFDFDLRQDLLVAHGQNDPGLYTRANEFLQPYASTHRHAVVIVDAEWEGSPGRDAISQRLNKHLVNAGWLDDSGCAVVITPELENWVWQDSPHVCSALGFDGAFAALRIALEAKGFWQPNTAKPDRPKEGVEWALRQARKGRSSAIYQQLAACVTARRCTDHAFQRLRSALLQWFPPVK
ncbi:methylation-associated defense system protein MAD4 [Thiomonas sp.]